MAVTTIFSGGTPPKEIGADTNGTANNDPSKVRFAKVLVNGDLVADIDARSATIGTTVVRDPQGNNFELVGSAVIISDALGVEYTGRRSMARTANVLNYDNDGSDQPITGIFVIGQGEGVDQASVYVQNTRGKVPLYEDNMSVKDQLDKTILTQMGSLQLSANSTANSGYTVELDPNLAPKYADLEVGQLIRLVINHGFTQEDGYFVIGKLRNNPTKQGQDKVTLELFPALDLRRSTSAILNKLTDSQIYFFSDMEVATGESDSRFLPEWQTGNPVDNSLNTDNSPKYSFWYPNPGPGIIPYEYADYHFLQESTSVSGQYALKTQIFDAYNQSGIASQLWRLLDKNGVALVDDCYYSYWVMYPQQIHYDHFALSRFGFTNHFQLYQKLPSNAPLCTVSAGYDNTNDTTFRWYFNVDCASSFDLAQVGGTPHVVPTETWMHVEVRWKRHFTAGIFQVWVDGVQILNYSGRTGNSTTTQHGCSIGNYGTLLSPTNPVIFYDDFLISSVPVHSFIFT